MDQQQLEKKWFIKSKDKNSTHKNWMTYLIKNSNLDNKNKYAKSMPSLWPLSAHSYKTSEQNLRTINSYQTLRTYYIGCTNFRKF